MELVKTFKKNPFEFIEVTKLSNLTKIIKYTNDKYRNSKPVIKDEEYDLLIDELKKRKPNHNLLKKIGSIVHTKNKTKLPYHMGSMDKIKPGNNLIKKWRKKFDGPYIYSDKLDGTSGLLELPNKKLYTRGNGKEGTDISSIIKYINGIPNYNSKKKIVVRGEFLISKENFKKFKKNYTNSRAMVNGLINKKCANPKELNLIDFVSYEVVYPSCKMSEQFKLLSKLKFNVVYNKSISNLNETNLSSILKSRKKNSEYDIDGIIVVDNKLHKRNINGNPKYAFAYKDILEEQIAKTTVVKVEWRISKDGLIKPRIHLEPVKIGGVTIKHVTGHNAKYVKLNGIGKGARIKLIRSGDVIPYILNVDKKVTPEFPKIEYIWTKNLIDIKINELNISEKSKSDLLVKNLTFFFKKMNIKNIDESIIKKFISVGLNSIYRILYACVDDFMNVEGFKDKMANKIHSNIKNGIKDVPLNRVMYASNIFGSGLGEKKLLLVIRKYPNILKSKKTKDNMIKMINEIDGFNTKTSTEFVNGLPKFKKFIKELPKIKITKIVIKINENSKYNNKIYVFTGFRNKELEKEIENGGGKVNNSISKKTDYLVVKNKNDSSSKITKAKELGIKIITINQI